MSSSSSPSKKRSLQGLDKVQLAIRKIQTELQKLQTNNHQEDSIQYKAALALSLGTLRFMGARLQGQHVGKQHSIRQELDRTKALLVRLQQRQRKEQKQKADQKNEKRAVEKEESTTADETTETEAKSMKPATKRRKSKK